jgi:hypothetical protein
VVDLLEIGKTKVVVLVYDKKWLTQKCNGEIVKTEGVTEELREALSTSQSDCLNGLVEGKPKGVHQKVKLKLQNSCCSVWVPSTPYSPQSP